MGNMWRKLRRTDDVERLEQENVDLQERVKNLQENLERSMNNKKPMKRPWGVDDDTNFFSPQKKDQLLQDINDLTLPNDCQNVNLIVIGIVGSGKSSLVNTWLTVLRNSGEISNIATVYGQYKKTTTKKFHEIILKTFPDGGKLCVYDCRGIFAESDSRSIHLDLISAIEGHVQRDYEFRGDQAIGERCLYYRAAPTLDQKMHCLIFVVDAKSIEEIDDEDLNIMREIKKYAARKNIPQRLVLTKVDELDLCRSGELASLFTSREPERKFKAAKIKFNLLENQILPVANYATAVRQNITQDILALKAIKNVTEEAIVYVRNNL